MNPILVLYKGNLTLTNNSLHLLSLIYTTGTVRRINCVKFLEQTGLKSRSSLFPITQAKLFGSAILPVPGGSLSSPGWQSTVTLSARFSWSTNEGS